MGEVFRSQALAWERDGGGSTSWFFVPRLESGNEMGEVLPPGFLSFDFKQLERNQHHLRLLFGFDRMQSFRHLLRRQKVYRSC
ncbi:hypothetical protein MiSe_07270 [Microseira wollei NIES-4236]|uniref:Transposase n=1 Tax=Microseira wollei NIES-4236 TaxID=2530354 RepID=A0AAV3WEU3_9CYAN|nr:hypothetical protein MiSe_07270 [Microseira wollei NIES-4236]